MRNLGLRKLPYSAKSRFTPDDVKLIKEIPNEDILYSEEEIAWMNRALLNLDQMIKIAAEHTGEIQWSMIKLRKNILDTLELVKTKTKVG